MLLALLLLTSQARASGEVHCFLSNDVVVAAEAPIASKLLAQLKRFTLAKFPGSTFAVGTPSVDARFQRMPTVLYPVRIRTPDGRALSLATEAVPTVPGLALPTFTRDTGFLSRCTVTPQLPDGYKFPVDVVDAQGRVLARTSVGTYVAPPERPDDGERGCLLQCPTDDNTGLPGQCDPSLLCDPSSVGR